MLKFLYNRKKCFDSNENKDSGEKGMEIKVIKEESKLGVKRKRIN